MKNLYNDFKKNRIYIEFTDIKEFLSEIDLDVYNLKNETYFILDIDHFDKKEIDGKINLIKQILETNCHKYIYMDYYQILVWSGVYDSFLIILYERKEV